MKNFLLIIFLIFAAMQPALFAQFGQNKVQYKDLDWYYIQTDHFDIYFNQKGESLAEFTAKESEKDLKLIEKSFNYKINNRISIIVYNSTNDFQETNITDEYLSEGIEGFTELFKNRVVIQFMGSYKEFRHLIHHELTHGVINDMFFGGSLQNIISNNISINIPSWFNEGMAEYQSLGWDINTDMFIRDAIISEYLPDVDQLNGYLAYRGGEAVWHYISEKYGEEKIGEIVNKLKGTGSVEEAFKSSLGLSLEEFNERWKKEIKKTYWPDIAIRKDPDEFAKRLTDPKKDGGFYNTSPALSPQGDKIAFISNRDTYFDVFIMNAIDGTIIKKLVKGNRTPDFEQLNVVTPGISWAPDESKIALTVKNDGYDAIYIIDVESGNKEILPIKMDGIKRVAWSPDSKYLAFVGHTPTQSDIYLYNINSKKLTNLTRDIFTDDDPSWSNDGKEIFFSSDRKNYLNASAIPDTFKVYKFNYNQTDIYSINISNREISRITDMPESDESFPICSPDGKEILFVSDLNGITNLYKKRIVLNDSDTVVSIENLKSVPITNSLTGISQPSVSKDGLKLVFATLYQGSYNLFLMNNPFESKTSLDSLVPTDYVAELRKHENEKKDEKNITENKFSIDSSRTNTIAFYTGNYIDSSHIYGDSVKVDFHNYVFGRGFKVDRDTSNLDKTKFTLADKLDSQGNYKVNKYKITFSPDIIYANAGYSSLYGLLGTTVFSFSDVLGNHRLIGVTSLQIDLKNSDYGLAYYYLPDRINYGIEGFHTARFVILSNGFGGNLYRFRNFGFVGSLSYPLNKFYRIEGGLSWLNISMENLDDPTIPIDKVSYVIPSFSFVHDNSLWGFTAPIDGTRYRFDFLGNPGFSKRKLDFYSILGDYRTYFRFWDYYSFAFRLSGGYSGGSSPQRFFIGGIENWINRRFANGYIPLESASDFAFLTPALPLRGFDYAQEVGTKYGLLNLELRFPLIRYLVTGPIPILFSNIFGAAFVDMGAAWNHSNDLRFFERNKDGNIVSRDLLMGTGLGARIFFLYFLMRFDVAWAYNVQSFSAPKFYFSLGADF
jgi:Tol biopolymer transport system component